MPPAVSFTRLKKKICAATGTAGIRDTTQSKHEYERAVQNRYPIDNENRNLISQPRVVPLAHGIRSANANQRLAELLTAQQL